MCSCYECSSQSQIYYNRLSVGRSVLVTSPHLRPKTRILLVRQLRVCWCGAPSLTRGRVCHLQLLLALTSTVILRSKSRGTHDHILLSQIPDSSNLEGQVPYLYLQEQGGPVIPPGTGFPCRCLLRLVGLRWKYSNQPPRRDMSVYGVDSFLYRADGVCVLLSSVQFPHLMMAISVKTYNASVMWKII
jgi:hypothetical protein